MSRRLAFFLSSLLSASLLALTLLLGGGLAARAQSDGVPMTGQAAIERSGIQPRFVLSASAADKSGWQLVAELSPEATRQPRGGGAGARDVSTPLSGQFTLSHAGIADTTGDATGSLRQDGSGQLRLLDSDGQTSLAARFAGRSGGGLSLNLSGQLPALPEPAAASVQPATHAFWYISRAAGLTAYLLLALNICLGLMVRTRALDWLLSRWRAFDLHQFTALLALGFLALHVFALLGDHYIGFNLEQLLIPFISPYRNVWIALGIVGLYLLALIVVSFYARRWIGYRGWRTIHYATFAAFLLALAHGLLAGTDTSQPWALVLYWSTGMLVSALMVWRFTTSGPGRTARPSLPSPPRELEPAGG